MILRIFIFVVLLSAASSCSAYYPGITGTVVDAETGKPIEGAVVLVEWTKRVGLGDYHTESVKVVEVITDKDGKFKISGLINPFVDPPDMTVYKKGYTAWNNKFIFPGNERRDDFKWQDGVNTRMSKFKSTYFHSQHVRFIRTVSKDSLESNKKKMFLAAYEWEIDLAREEIIENKQ